MKFDEIITSPPRLAILACLIPGEPRSFTDLKRATGLADGNLHVQTRKLAAAGHIEILKGQRGQRSWTRFRVTEHGVASMKLYVRKLQAIISTESGSIRPNPPTARPDRSQVWLK
jgi:DNA-binding MarR family transcriptional regulator